MRTPPPQALLIVCTVTLSHPWSGGVEHPKVQEYRAIKLLRSVVNRDLLSLSQTACCLHVQGAAPAQETKNCGPTREAAVTASCVAHLCGNHRHVNSTNTMCTLCIAHLIVSHSRGSLMSRFRLYLLSWAGGQHNCSSRVKLPNKETATEQIAVYIRAWPEKHVLVWHRRASVLNCGYF